MDLRIAANKIVFAGATGSTSNAATFCVHILRIESKKLVF